jgi:hypothetical protein
LCTSLAESLFMARNRQIDPCSIRPDVRVERHFSLFRCRNRFFSPYE